MIKNKKKTILLLCLMAIVGTSNAQIGRLLENALKKKNKNKTEQTESKSEKSEVGTLNQWHKANEGKVIFYAKPILAESSSSSDSETGVIKEKVLAGNGAFSFRAYLGKSYKDFEGCKGFDIRYTMGGVSLTTDQVIAELPQYYERMASNYAYYDKTNATVGVPLDSDKGQYLDQYTKQEDTYRILLSKIKDKLVKGATLTLKVEIIGRGEQFENPNDVVMAVGEIPIKITDESSNLQGVHCRCGKPGLTDAKIIKEVKDAFAYQFDGVKKVYKVVMLSREFTQNYDNSYPVKNVTSKGMWANIIYEGDNGIFMMVKRYVFFKKVGNSFSDKATIGKQKFYLPVSPTCVM